jgi:arylsulfatase A-like enzyme
MSFTILRIILVGCILSFVFQSCKGKEEPMDTATKKGPNVVLIMADDQGWGDLSSSGNSNLSTPNIDALAKNGASFENFYVQPVCSPTRAELLTGRHFTRLGVYETSSGGERLNLDETTLADVLKSAGYATAAYGKWHNGMQPPYHPNARGFDDFYGFASGHWGNYFSPMLEHNGTIVKGNGFLVDDLTDKGLAFIEKNKDQPFFLYLPYNTPHSPMQVPDAYWDRFKDKPLENLYHGEEQEDLKFTKAALAMVENIDFNVGRIISQLQELNLEENTIVIYLSDNGPNGFRWNGGMRGKKGWVDEGGVRTPFYIQWKDSIPAGKSIKEIASAIDLLPTLADMTNVVLQTEKPLDGKNLSPLIFEDNVSWDERLVFNHWNGKTSVRSQNYRLDDEGRLYDMTADLGQTNDVATVYPTIKDSLEMEKTNWLLETLSITKENDTRPFTVGHPEYEYTQLPARDGTPHGEIKRSNRFPNDTFFTNWISEKDSITWDIDVVADGTFEVELFYTCPPASVGSILELSMDKSKIATKIKESNDAALTGMENDRVPRMESYVKEFVSMKLGKMVLKKGKGILTLKALEMNGKSVADVRLLLFRRID